MAAQRFNPRQYRYWLLSMSGLLAVILLTFGWSSKGVQAELRPAATPTPARRPAWSSGGASQAPTKLQNTAQVFTGGGYPPLRVCQGIFAEADAAIYDIYPDLGTFAIGHPYVNGLIVGACHGVGPEPVYLIDPTGQRIEPTYRSHDVIRCAGNGCYLYDFALPSNAPEGEYLLRIESTTGLITTTLEGRRPWFPYLTITNTAPVDAEENPVGGVLAQRGQTLLLNFHGFAHSDITVEAVLYQENPDGLEWRAIDAWQFQTDSNGEYVEELQIPSDALSTTYVVVACAFYDCQPTLDRGVAPIMEYRTVAPPLLAWEMFFVSDAQGQGDGQPDVTAVVDPVIAWNGIILKDDPNGARIGGLAANRSLTVLGAPVTADNGTEWIEVEDDATGRRGWVNARYILFDTIENTYINLYWTPGCDPQRPVVQLLTVGEQPCTPGASYLSLDDFADELRGINLLTQEEWLEPVATGGRPNESLLIRTAANARVGWLKIGTANPLSRPSPVGAVWRTPYNTDALVGSVCWRRLDGEWRCENR